MVGDPNRIGEYVLLGPLYGGRTVETLRARKSGRLFSLRLLRAQHGRDPREVEAFVARGRAALQFKGPHLARATQVGRADGRYFIATDYLAGQTLQALLDRCRRSGQRLSLGHAAAIAQAAAAGLAGAHETLRPCRVHPGDVLLGYDGTVRLLVAEAPDGVPVYAAPEQIRGQEANESADLFVLGAMLFEMLTLEAAFAAESEFQSLEKVRRAEVPPPSLWNDRVPAEMDDLVRKACAREPIARFPGAAALAEALVNLQKGYLFGPADLQDLLRRLFPDEVRAEAEDRLGVEEAPDAAASIKDKLAASKMGLGAVFWIGIVVMVAGAAWLASGR